jgi:hypothetical protein
LVYEELKPEGGDPVDKMVIDTLDWVYEKMIETIYSPSPFYERAINEGRD